MPVLKNAKHEAFAQAVASGKTGVQAYRDSVSDTCTVKTAMQEASRLLKNPNVSSRVAELKTVCSDIANERYGWDKSKLISYLIETLETPIGEVDEDHRLCQEQTVSEKERKVKLFPKAEASKQLAALCGWNEPEQVENKLEIVIKTLG